MAFQLTHEGWRKNDFLGEEMLPGPFEKRPMDGLHQPALPAPVDYFRAGVSWKWLTRLQTNVISSGYTSTGLIQMFHTITLHYIWPSRLI